jgi:DNA-binding response OmpR family regulator
LEKSILIVDDEPIILSLVQEFMETYGYKVRTATNGKDALDIVKNDESIRLVLTDVKMENLTGLDLLKLIKDFRKDMPVIIITGYKTIENTIEALRNGAVDFITKPFNLSELKKIVDRIFLTKEKEEFVKNLNTYITHFLVEYTFTARQLNTEAISRYLSDLLIEKNVCAPGEATQYYIVFNEAIVNALEHGCLELSSMLKENDLDENKFRQLKEKRLQDDHFGNRKIAIQLEIFPESFFFTVEDEGPGFDYQKILKNLQSPVPNLDAFGRGFMFMSHMMDSIEFNEKGNRVTLKKVLGNDK